MDEFSKFPSLAGNSPNFDSPTEMPRISRKLPLHTSRAGYITQTKAIRLKCRDCSETLPDIKNCESFDCPIHPGRMGKRPKGFKPLKAIRAYCLWCCNGQWYEVQKCPSTDCVFWNFRFGMKLETYKKMMRRIFSRIIGREGM